MTGLQRTRGIEVVESQVAVDVGSPLQDAQDDNRDQPESVLAKVATDLTRERLPPAFEMARPLSELSEALSSGHRPGVLLVGPSGTGKTALVQELVRRRGEFHLAQTPFWSTSGSRIVAGMSGFGMWQQRCRDLAQEVSSAGAVLHVDNLVELIGAGRHIGNRQGVAAFLRPHVERGDLRVIAECAPEQIAVVEREEPRLLAAFHRLNVPQPTPEQERGILRHAARTAAAAGHVRNVVRAGAEDAPGAAPRRRGTPPGGTDAAPITDGAIETLAFLHRRFSTSSAHPGRPLRFLKNLIDDSGRSDVVGEAEVVAAFARETGLPRFLLDQNRRNVWLLSPQRLISGMSFVGQWEERLLGILREAGRRDHVLYFDDLLGLYRAGATVDSPVTAADVLKPHVRRREVRVLAEMTPETLRVLAERDRGLADEFHVLRIEPTDAATTGRILSGVRRRLEIRNRCAFDADVLPDLQRRYVRDAEFPGKGAAFLDHLALKNRGSPVTRDTVHEQFQERTGLALALLDGRCKLARRDVLAALRHRVLGQEAALEALADVVSVAKARLNATDRPLTSSTCCWGCSTPRPQDRGSVVGSRCAFRYRPADVPRYVARLAAAGLDFFRVLIERMPK